MRIHVALLIPSALAIGIVHPAYGAQGEALSQNYLQSVVLHRAGGPSNDLPAELEQVVRKHNKKLTENPAAKNRNRIVYLNGPEQYKPVRFPIGEGTVVVDGSGKRLGLAAARTTQINFGQHKQIDGKDHVMAFSIRTRDAGTITGWIALSALLPSPERTQYEPVLAMNVEDGPEQGDAPMSYRIDCGRPGKWGDGRLKVVANVDDRRQKHEAAGDYVERPNGTCYLLTNLPNEGGVASDILSNGATFVPDAGVPAVQLPLYLPADATDRERNLWEQGRLPHEMEFRYGRVGSRYGWIATADLRK